MKRVLSTPSSDEPALKRYKNMVRAESEVTVIEAVFSKKMLDKLFYLKRTIDLHPRLCICGPSFSYVTLRGRFFHPTDDDYSILLHTTTESNKCAVFDNANPRIEDDGDVEKVALVQQGLRQFQTFWELLLALRKNAGRNETEWIQVDEDTRKKRCSGSQSIPYRFFCQHPLGEKQLLCVIVSYL